MSETVLQLLSAAAVVLITRYLVPYLRAGLQGKKQEELIGKVEQYVEAAEQLYKGVKLGTERMKYVSGLLEEEVIKTDGKVRALIEAAVRRL